MYYGASRESNMAQFVFSPGVVTVRLGKPLPSKKAEKQEKAMRAEAEKRRADRSADRRLFSTSYSLSIPYRTLSRVQGLTLSGDEDTGGRPVFVLERAAANAAVECPEGAQ